MQLRKAGKIKAGQHHEGNKDHPINIIGGPPAQLAKAREYHPACVLHHGLVSTVAHTSLLKVPQEQMPERLQNDIAIESYQANAVRESQQTVEKGLIDNQFHKSDSSVNLEATRSLPLIIKARNATNLSCSVINVPRTWSHFELW